MRKLLFLVGFGLTLLLAACGGGDGSTFSNFTETPATAAGKPTVLHLSCVASVVEGQAATCTASKSGGNGKPVAATWTASNGANGSVTLSGGTPVEIAIPTVDDNDVNGTRSISVLLRASGSTGALAGAVFDVTDNDVATPPPPPPPVSCPDGSSVPAGSTCPTPPPPPPPPATQTCPDGSVIPAADVCPAPPPPPPPATISLGGSVTATDACPSVNGNGSALVVGMVYKVVGFAGWMPEGGQRSSPNGTIDEMGPPPGTADIVVLNDPATMRGDGIFGLYVAPACVTPLP